jgi:hypothetical protein
MLKGITKYLQRHHVALLALFLALGGTSFAAASYINGKQIKPHSIPQNRLTKVAVKALRGHKGAQGQRGSSGAQGVQGVQGPPGSPDTPIQVRDKLVASGGVIRVSAGTSNWRPYLSSDPLTFTYYTNYTGITRSAAGASYLTVHPTVPSALYGKSFQLRGFELCYTTNTGVTFTNASLNVSSYASNGDSTANTVILDTTTRNDKACRTSMTSSPVVLTPNDDVAVYVYATWTNTSAVLYLGQVSIFLEPTATATAAPSSGHPRGRPSVVPVATP